MLSPRLGSGLQSGARSGFHSGSGPSSPGASRLPSAGLIQCSPSSASKTVSPVMGLRSALQGGNKKASFTSSPSNTFLGSSHQDLSGGTLKSETKTATPPSFQASPQAGRSHCITVSHHSSSEQVRRKSHH